MTQKLVAEFVGTLGLLLVVAGSGIMGLELSGGNIAVALLANAIATGAGLYVLISIFGPVSGAHFNPAVTLFARLAGEMTTGDAMRYWAVQIAGGITGIWLAHLIFDLPILQVSANPRSGFPMFVSELIATATLLLVIRMGIRQENGNVAAYVAMIVTAGYWFTPSTFFANPAVTIARVFSDSFVGIRPIDALMFLAAQILATVVLYFGAKAWLKKV